MSKGFLKAYATEMALYGGAVITILTLTGYFSAADAFFREHRSICVIGVIIHFVLSWINLAARRERRELEKLRKGTEPRK